MGMVEKSFGWSTDKITRKTIIDHMAAELIDENFDIPDKGVLKELKTFIVNERGKPEAAPVIMMIMFWLPRSHCIILIPRANISFQRRKRLLIGCCTRIRAFYALMASCGSR